MSETWTRDVLVGICENGNEEETFYLPTPERLARSAGGDWY